jgi:hypothetical protein
MSRVEVKTKRKERNKPRPKKGFGFVEGEWLMSKKSPKPNKRLFYCFVNASVEGGFEFYVVPSHVVNASVAARLRYLGLKVGGKGVPKFRLGRKGTSYTSKVPYATDHRDKRGFLSK